MSILSPQSNILITIWRASNSKVFWYKLIINPGVCYLSSWIISQPPLVGEWVHFCHPLLFSCPSITFLLGFPVSALPSCSVFPSLRYLPARFSRLLMTAHLCRAPCLNTWTTEIGVKIAIAHYQICQHSGIMVAEAPPPNSGLALADYGKNSARPSLIIRRVFFISKYKNNTQSWAR